MKIDKLPFRFRFGVLYCALVLDSLCQTPPFGLLLRPIPHWSRVTCGYEAYLIERGSMKLSPWLL